MTRQMSTEEGVTSLLPGDQQGMEEWIATVGLFVIPAAGEHMPGSESFSNWLSSHLELAGNEGMEKRMQTTIVGHIGYHKDPFLHS